VTNQFDNKAAQWDDDPRRVKMAQALAAAIAAAVPLHPGMKALEFGCGTGLVTTVLAPQLGVVDAVDSSAGMLEVLRRKIQALAMSNIRPIQIDLTGDQRIKGQYDVIFSCMVFHHIHNYASILNQFFSLLKPGGWIAVADLAAEDGSFHGPETHIEHQGFDCNVFKDTLESIGYTNFSDTTAFVIPREQPDRTRYYPVFLVTGQKPDL